MFAVMKRLGWLWCGLLAIALMVGCAHREYRKMSVKEEQREGDVQEVSPGEMVVE